MINNAEELTALVLEIGLLPLFRSRFPGFSVEDCTPPERWFVKDVEGPWNWRETLANEGRIAYAKCLERKAAFIAPDCYPDLVNYRRGGMDFDDRYADGVIHRHEKLLMDALRRHGPQRTSDLKKRSGLVKGFDGALTTLQMRMDATIHRLEYRQDAFGKPYGWGISRIARVEDAFDEAFVTSRYDDPPEVSLERLVGRVRKCLPDVSEQEIVLLLR